MTHSESFSGLLAASTARRHLTASLASVQWDTMPIETLIEVFEAIQRARKEQEYVETVCKAHS